MPTMTPDSLMSNIAPKADIIARQSQLAGFIGGMKEGPPEAVLASWDPPFCGDIGLYIDKDGRWFQGEEPFTRPALVALFAKILRREGDESHVLVTPYEKISVRVADTPFLIVDLQKVEAKDGQIAYDGLTNLGDIVHIGPGHSIVSESETRALVRVRGGLMARFSRTCFFDLVSGGEVKDGRVLFSSRGAIFDLGSEI